MSHQTVEHQGQTIGSVPPVAERPIFLKLGGSLITDKRQMEAVRPELIAQLAAEIAETRRQHPALQLVIGHGSGSFGHVHAARHGTRAGVASAKEWMGFAQTGDAAARLNRIVVAALLEAGVPAWGLQPGALLWAKQGAIAQGFADNIGGALQRGLVPVLYGDVLLDEARGGTIASTEEIFEWLLPVLHPQRIVLAGEVDGIYSADPLVDPTATRIAVVTPARLGTIQHGLGGSHGIDVTGGMAAKVQQAVAMIEAVTDLDVVICSGLVAGQLQRAIGQKSTDVGTRVTLRTYP